MSEQILYRTTAILCPICQENKTIEIPEYIFQQKQIGIIKIQIRSGTVCPHEFIAFIDQLGIVRGYEQIDYQIQFTSHTTEEHVASDKFYLEDLLETIGDFATIRLFHAFIFNYKIFILITPSDNPRFVDKLNKLFFSFFPADIQPMKLAESMDRKSFAALDIEESNCLILNTSGLIANSPWGDQKRFDFETEVIKKALEILDVSSQFLLIQQEIAGLKCKAELIIKFLKKTEKIYKDDLKDKLTNQFQAKMSDNLLDLYTLFIKQRLPGLASQLNKIHDRSVETLRDGIW